LKAYIDEVASLPGPPGPVGPAPTLEAGDAESVLGGPASIGVNDLGGGTYSIDLGIPLANWTVADTVTGAPGTDADVEQGGTDFEPTLTFTIPQGLPGADGTNGTNGTNGTDGLTPELRGLSVTSTTIGTGSKTFAISPSMNVAFPVGSFVRAQGASTANWMGGLVTAASTSSVTINVVENGGSGTFASWTLTISSNKGVDGTGTVNSVNSVSPTLGNVDVKGLIPVATATSPTTVINDYVKIATFSLSAVNVDINSLVHVQATSLATADREAIIALKVRNFSTMASAPIVSVSILTSSALFATTDVVAILTANDGTNPNVVEVYLKRVTTSSRYAVTDLGTSASAATATVTWAGAGTWLNGAALPAGTQFTGTVVDDARYVGLTGNQTIAGVKTFSNGAIFNAGLSASGDVILGSGSKWTYTKSAATYTPNNQVLGTTGTAAGMAFARFSNDTNSPILTLAKSRGTSTTPGTYTAVQANDDIGSIIFNATDGTAFADVARINVSAIGTVATGSVPGQIAFMVTSQGGTQPLTRMVLEQAGATIGGALSPTHTVTLMSNATGIAQYNTVDQTTNYERVRQYWSSNVFTIGGEIGGTGTQRDIRITTGGSELRVNGSSGLVAKRDNTSVPSVLQITSSGLTASSGTQSGLLVDPTINQTGTASYTALRVNVTETATGSGSKDLLGLMVGGVNRLTVSNGGYVRSNPVASTDGAFSAAVVGDTNSRWLSRADGLQAWGPGNTATDTTMQRTGVNEITFSGAVKASTAAVATDDTTLATTAYVKDAIQGSVVALGSIGGSVSLSSSLTASTAVNATVTATLTSNTTFTAATMPTVAAGTQFFMKITQDGTGSRTLTLTDIYKAGGASGLVLSTTAGAIDLLGFFYDGSIWIATMVAKGLAV